MDLIIKQSGALVAQVEDYDGPIPRVGEYIFQPPLNGPITEQTSVMSVKTVTYGILTRETGLGHFAGNAAPFVEVWV